MRATDESETKVERERVKIEKKKRNTGCGQDTRKAQESVYCIYTYGVWFLLTREPGSQVADAFYLFIENH